MHENFTNGLLGHIAVIYKRLQGREWHSFKKYHFINDQEVAEHITGLTSSFK